SARLNKKVVAFQRSVFPDVCAPNLPRFPSIFLNTMPFNLTFRCCFTESIILKAKGITSLFFRNIPQVTIAK
ncbi:hypothetical protein, partial [Parabacteroides merdae]|uniref:hypothetical protein n=1 Tax=Parabacteroides merdae TaxID=46503 RepID=UPI001E3F802B